MRRSVAERPRRKLRGAQAEHAAGCSPPTATSPGPPACRAQHTVMAAETAGKGGEAEEKGGAVHSGLADDAGVAHMGSKIFVNRYMGNCFTCHNVDGTGEFQVLTQAVTVDEKGIPETLPIPGAQDPR